MLNAGTGGAMKKKLFLTLVLFVAVAIVGCADVKTPTAGYALTHPLSTKTMVVSGTAEDEVLEKWGEPDQIIETGYDEQGLKKETWVYDAWMPYTPVDFRHLSKSKKIFFVGGYVTGYEDIEVKEELQK